MLSASGPVVNSASKCPLVTTGTPNKWVWRKRSTSMRKISQSVSQSLSQSVSLPSRCSLRWRCPSFSHTPRRHPNTKSPQNVVFILNVTGKISNLSKSCWTDRYLSAASFSLTNSSRAPSTVDSGLHPPSPRSLSLGTCMRSLADLHVVVVVIARGRQTVRCFQAKKSFPAV